MHQGTGYGDPLLLTSTELPGNRPHSLSQPNGFENLFGSTLRLLMRKPVEQQGDCDVLDSIERGKQIERLKNEAE